LVKMQINFAFCMTILNCWYGTTENWQISWGISFHTNASTSVAVTNGTSFPFLWTRSYLMSHNIIIPNLVLWPGLTFQIENTLSCRRVWKVDLWNIYKNSTVTVNKHTVLSKTKKLLLFWKYFHFWQWLIE